MEDFAFLGHEGVEAELHLAMAVQEDIFGLNVGVEQGMGLPEMHEVDHGEQQVPQGVFSEGVVGRLAVVDFLFEVFVVPLQKQGEMLVVTTITAKLDTKGTFCSTKRSDSWSGCWIF